MFTVWPIYGEKFGNFLEKHCLFFSFIFLQFNAHLVQTAELQCIKTKILVQGHYVARLNVAQMNVARLNVARPNVTFITFD
jgi:hypothetical protein